MDFFPKRETFIGIEQSRFRTRSATLRKGRKGWQVVALKEILKEENVNPLYTGLKEAIVLSAIPSRNVLIRSLEMPVIKTKDIFSALDFQIEPLLPFPLEQAIVGAQILEKKENSANVTAFVIRKDHLQKHLEELPQEVESVTCIPYALAAFSTLLMKGPAPALMVHVGDDEINCVLVEQGRVLTSRAFEKDLDFAIEIQKTLLRFSTSCKTKSFETVFLLGDPHFHAQLQDLTSKNVLFPVASSIAVSQEDLMRFGLAIGIALSSEGPNFRQKEYLSPRPFKRLQKPLFGCLLFACIFAVTLFELGESALKHQKNAIQEAYATLLSSEGKKESIPLQTAHAYLAELDKLEKEISNRQETYPLLPQVPKVKDFLAWLSLLPQMEEAIEITNLHYCMVKRPELKRKKEHYKVKIDLEFSAPSPMIARSFQDALSTENPFVDAKEEVKWKSAKGQYLMEFYLKDKTRYP